MGGDKHGTSTGSTGKDEKGVARWLQAVIDTLAAEYGWTKNDILDMYPRELEILVELARKRREQESDMQQYQMAIAACVPHMKDGGKQFLRDLVSKYKRYDDGSDVTPESIARDNDIAKMVLGM